jgi:TRAP-type C4-dicarboxylate transport system permease small subunit
MSPVTGALRALDRGSARASEWLYAFGVYGALPTLLGLVTIDVALRYFFSAPLQWGRDANGLLLLMTLFSALPAAWDRGHHIRMEIFYLRLRPSSRVIADVVSALAGIVTFGLLAVQAVLFARYMARTGETGEDLDIGLWPFMIYIAICGAVFVGRLIANPTVAPREDEAGKGSWI